MGKKEKQKTEKKSLINLQEGIGMIDRHSLFGRLGGWVCPVKKDALGKQTASVVTAEGRIYVNEDLLLSPEEWVYILAHQRLHLAFGHFDAAKMPYGEEAGPSGKVDIRLWNMACDLYIMGFLNDLKVGRCPVRVPEHGRTGGDEVKIYQRLLFPGDMQEERHAADALMELIHMKGLESPMSDGGKLSVFYTITKNGLEELRRLILENLSENPVQFLTNARIKLSCASFLSKDECADLFFRIKSLAMRHKFNAEAAIDDEYNHLSFYQRIILDNTICEYANFITILEGLGKENAGSSK